MKYLMRKVRVALTPRRWFLKTRLANGAVVYGKNRAGFGGRGIYVYRDSIEPEYEHLESFLGPAGVFVDVGASTGIYTIKAAKHYAGNGVVLALEPFPDILATLYRSVQANGFTNVRLRNLCAGARTTVRQFWMNSAEPHYFSLVKGDTDPTALSVLTVALDDLFKWEELSRLDYLKIDVEGAEHEVLMGARKTIEKFRPIIQAEVSNKDVTIDLSAYSTFRPHLSPNKVFIPDEHEKIHVAESLGWVRVD